MELDAEKLLAKYANRNSDGWRVGSTTAQWGEDPRATVILIACDVERALNELLSAFLCYLSGAESNEKETKGLIGGSGKWTSFSRLNAVAINLRLITKTECKDLSLLAEVRNCYAHSTVSELEKEETRSKIKKDIRDCQLHRVFEAIALLAAPLDKDLVVMDMIADELIRRFRCREQRFRSKPGKGYAELSVGPEHDEW